MRIAVDAMGGDYAPREIVAGAVKWVQENEGMVYLVGNEHVIHEELAAYIFNEDQIKVVQASQVITMDESPAIALRKKKDASVVVATRLVKEGRADAVLSCGSTGAQMAAALFVLGRMEGVERPPIASSIPSAGGGNALLIDVGANVDCRPAQLLQFAAVGSAYAAAVSGIQSPRVALLNNGEEEGKGNALSVETYQLLKFQNGLNFVGNIEGRDLFSGHADVIICDGFTGNIVLKALEGMAMFLAASVAGELGKVPAVFAELDYTQVGGAPLLGVNGISIVCHGSSRREAVFNGIRSAQNCFERNIVERQLTKLRDLI